MSKTEKREDAARFHKDTVSKHKQNNKIQKEYNEKYIRLLINPDFKRFKIGVCIYVVPFKFTLTNRLILIEINKINRLYSVYMIKN